MSDMEIFLVGFAAGIPVGAGVLWLAYRLGDTLPGIRVRRR